MPLSPKPQKLYQLYLPLALFFLVGQLLVILSSWRYLPPSVPLFYSRPWGKEQLASPLMLFILPGLSLAIILINSLLSSMVAKEVLMKRVLASMASLFSFLCLITLVQIIRLIT